jgi:hypothetical protein
LQELIDKFRARFYQLFGRKAGVKNMPQPLLKCIDMRLDGGAIQFVLRPVPG